jgi:hypothetical protein
MNLRIDPNALVAWGAFTMCAVLILALTWGESAPKPGPTLEPIRWARFAPADAASDLVHAGQASRAISRGEAKHD